MKRAILALALTLGLASAGFGQVRSITADLTAADSSCLTTNCVTLYLPVTAGAVTMQLSGTFSATAQFEGTADPANLPWVPIGGIPIDGGSSVTSASAAGIWQFSAAGLIAVRVRVNSYTSGTMSVAIAYANASTGGAGTTTTSADININQVGGDSTATVGTGIIKVGIVDSSGNSITASTDPCDGSLATTVAISQAADAVVISAAAAKKNYICSITIVAAAAEVVGIEEGTGSTCGTGTVAIAGSTTQANGMSLAANGGFTSNRTISGSGTNVDTCLVQSGTARVSGWLTYVQQ